MSVHTEFQIRHDHEDICAHKMNISKCTSYQLRLKLTVPEPCINRLSYPIWKTWLKGHGRMFLSWWQSGREDGVDIQYRLVLANDVKHPRNKDEDKLRQWSWQRRQVKEVIKQSCRALPKTLTRPLWYRIAENNSYGDLLSHSSMHTDGWDEVVYTGTWQGKRGKTLDALVCAIHLWHHS